MWIVFPTQLGSVAGKNKGGTDGFFSPSPLCTSLPSSYCKLGFWLLHAWNAQRKERKRGEQESSYWTGSAVSWKPHFLALTGVCLKVFPFMRVFVVSLGFTRGCHIHRFLMKANASPSQLIAYSLLSPWEPGNREGEPSLLRSVHSSRWPSRAGPRWPRVFVCAHTHARSLSCGPRQIHTRPSALFPRWLRVSQQSCQHLPTRLRPHFRSVAQQFGSHLQSFCSMRASGTDTLDPPWQGHLANSQVEQFSPQGLRWGVHIIHPALHWAWGNLLSYFSIFWT